MGDCWVSGRLTTDVAGSCNRLLSPSNPLRKLTELTRKGFRQSTLGSTFGYMAGFVIDSLQSLRSGLQVPRTLPWAEGVVGSNPIARPIFL
jgi:hypothetical protein